MLGPTIRVVMIGLVVPAVIGISGCYHTYRKIDNTPESIQESIRPGNIVKLVTTDNSELRFKVAKIDTQSISSDERQILFSDISTIKRGRLHILLLDLFSLH